LQRGLQFDARLAAIEREPIRGNAVNGVLTKMPVYRPLAGILAGFGAN
jgi:hypothetical protein